MTHDEYLDQLDQIEKSWVDREISADTALGLRVSAIMELWRSEMTEPGD
jgi:hypothetical protein